MKKLLFLFAVPFLFLGCQGLNLENAEDIIVTDSDAELIFVSPHNGAEDVSGKTPVTFLWDEPVFKLQNPEVTQTFLEKNITITPDIEGSWQMLGTTGILFEPKNEWKGSTQYTFALADNLLSTPLTLEYSFQTPRIEMTRLTADDLIMKRPLTLQFNQEITPEEGKKILVEPSVSLDVVQHTYTQRDKEGKEISKTDPQALDFIPSTNWPEDTEFTLTVPAGLGSAEGPLLTQESHTETFRSIPPLTIDINRPDDVFGSVSFNFSTDVPTEGIFDKISVTSPSNLLPEDYLEKAKEQFFENNTREETRYLWLPHPGENWAPGEEYTVTMEAGISDKYGRVTDKDTTITFTTEFPDTIQPVFFPYETRAFAYGTVPDFSMWYSGTIQSPTLTFRQTLPGDSSQTINFDWASSPDKRTVKEFDLSDHFSDFFNESGALAPGMYELKLSWKSPYGGWTQDRTATFAVVDFPVEMKINADDTLQISAQDFEGNPLEETFDIVVYERNWKGDGNVIQEANRVEGVTLPYEIDAQNTFAVLVQNENHKGIGASGFASGMNPYDSPVDYSPYRYNNPLTGVLFPDRPLFRPGDTLYFKSLFRERNFFQKAFPLKDVDPDQSYTATLKILNPEWEEMYSDEMTITGGALDGSWDIPEDGRLGQYQLQIRLKTGEDEQTSEQTLNASFYVTEYRKPDFLIDSSFDTEKAVYQEKINAEISAEYAFGGALSGKDVRYTVSLFGYQEGDWYWWPRESKDKVITSGRDVLDKEGKLIVPVDLDIELEDDIDWTLVNLDVTVQTAHESESSQTISVPFYASQRQISITPEKYFYLSNDEAITFSGEVKDLEEELLTEEKVTAELFRTKWVRNDRKNSQGDFMGEWKETEEKVDTQIIKTDDTGTFKGTFEVPEEASQYFVRVTAKDKKSRIATAEHHFWVWTDEQSKYTLRQNEKDRILPLYSDKEAYRVGDTVEILFPHNEWDISYAHAALERGKSLETLEANLEDNTVSFTVEDWMVPNVYVTLLISGQNEDGNPEVRWGAINVPIKDDSHTLEVSVTPDKETYKPQETVKFRVNTTVEGEGTPGEVTIAVVDQTLLALRSRPDLELWKSFLSELPLGVQTTHTLANMLTETDLEEIYEEVESVKAMADSAFGGGGGKGEDFQPRGEFKDTAAFLAKVKTDENGQATAEFTLPDNLTTWHVWAVGATDDNAFGETETEIQTTLPLLLSPITPNFLRAGDETQVGLLIRRNITDPLSEDITVTLDLPEGIHFEGEHTKVVNVKDEARVYFDVKVPYNKETLPVDGRDIDVVLSIEAAQSGLKDQVKLVRNIRPPKVETSAAEFLEITYPQELTFKTDDRSLHSTLKVHTFGSLLSRLEQFVDIAKEQNFLCAEQNFSDGTAQIIWHDIQASLGKNPDPIDIDKFQDIRDDILQKQDSSGGFNFWSRSPEPSVWLTANILEFAPLWAEKNVEFNKERLDNASSWLREQVFIPCEKDNDCLDDTTRQYAAYVLAQRGSLTPADTEFLTGYRGSLESQAWFLRLTQVLDGELPPLTRDAVADITENVERSLDVRERLAFWSEDEKHRTFYSQNERLTAILFDGVRAEDFLPSRHAHIARYLAESESFLSGNTALRILASLQSYDQGKEDDFPAEILIENKKSEEEITELMRVTLQTPDQNMHVEGTMPKGKEETLLISSPNEKKFYTDIELREVFPARELQSIQKGFWIERHLYELSDTDFENPLTILNAGENYLARIKVVTNTDHRQVMIEDSIPTGAEGVNFDLENEDRQLQQYLEDDDEMMPYRGWFRPFIAHQEFYFDKMRMFVPYMSAGTHEFEYILRARIAGNYQHLPVKIMQMYYPETFATGEGQEIEIVK